MYNLHFKNFVVYKYYFNEKFRDSFSEKQYTRNEKKHVNNQGPVS